MHPESTKRYLLIGLSLFACLSGVLFLTGCGKEQLDTSGASSMPPPQASKSAATGPAVSEPMAFDQLALESAVKRVTTKQGLAFLHFSYADADGKVYKCVLPEAMSKQPNLPDEWLRIFSVYRLPDVVKQKAAPKNPLSKGVTDFPFISPRPSSTTQSSTQNQTSEEAPPAPPPAAPMPPGGRGDRD